MREKGVCGKKERKVTESKTYIKENVQLTIYKKSEEKLDKFRHRHTDTRQDGNK